MSSMMVFEGSVTVTPPPIMIPSANMLREVADDHFTQLLEQTASTAIEEVEEPIDYNQVVEQATDNNPSIPFFPNKLLSMWYYPLLIKTNDLYNATQVVAPFIYYHNRGQEVVGTMGQDKPLYAAPIYLTTPTPTHLPIPLTNSQILQFSTKNPHAYAIDKML